MIHPDQNARKIPRLHIDTEEIFTHVANAQTIAACSVCDTNTAALIADIALLLAEITWLYRSLIQMRQRAANLEAAIRAALSAQEDGDHDPLGYLRDEITSDTGAAYGA
jgi:hypothetical protein